MFIKDKRRNSMDEMELKEEIERLKDELSIAKRKCDKAFGEQGRLRDVVEECHSDYDARKIQHQLALDELKKEVEKLTQELEDKDKELKGLREWGNKQCEEIMQLRVENADLRTQRYKELEAVEEKLGLEHAAFCRAVGEIKVKDERLQEQEKQIIGLLEDYNILKEKYNKLSEGKNSDPAYADLQASFHRVCDENTELGKEVQRLKEDLITSFRSTQTMFNLWLSATNRR
jgi:chromosome segregation ATPase